MADLTSRLKKKGWSEEEIERAMEIISSEEKTKENLIFKTKTEPFVYWLSVIIAVIGNILVSVAIVPYMFMLSFYSYFVIGLLGLCIGTLFAFLLRDLSYIDPKHHIVTWIFVPALALINFYYSVVVSNKIQEALKIGYSQEPIFIGLTYVIAFVLPFIIIYGVWGIKSRKENKRRRI